MNSLPSGATRKCSTSSAAVVGRAARSGGAAPRARSAGRARPRPAAPPCRPLQAIQRVLDERLDRARQVRLRRLPGIEQQLQQEERVAFGALERTRAPAPAAMRRGEARPGARASSPSSGTRSMPVSGAPCSALRQAPALGSPAKRVVITRQQRLRCAASAASGGKALERPGVGPVDVLDQQQQRRAARSRAARDRASVSPTPRTRAVARHRGGVDRA